MLFVEEGQSPLISCLPHSGTQLPISIERRLNATGRLQTDLSWRLEHAFDFRGILDATILRSSISRYVIDLDRDPTTPLSESLNPARALCPVTTLDGKRIYSEEEEPGLIEIEERLLLFHTPFHKALRYQIDRLLQIHRNVILLDCQSMRSQIKGVSDRGLHSVSIGTMDGKSCAPGMRNLLANSFQDHQGYSISLDEQIKGAYLLENYGRPNRGIHAASLLFAQRTYLRHETPPFEPDKTRTKRLKSIILDAATELLDWAGKKNTDSDGAAQVQAGKPVEDPSFLFAE